jgi:hypothetical protein
MLGNCVSEESTSGQKNQEVTKHHKHSVMFGVLRVLSMDHSIRSADVWS